jgi:hypothetical protein
VWKRGHQQPFVVGGGPKDGGSGTAAATAITVTLSATVAILRGWQPARHAFRQSKDLSQAGELGQAAGRGRGGAAISGS